MLTHPDVAALGCRVEAFADDGPVGEGLALYVAWQNGLITPAEHARERFVESPLCHPSVMLRRTAYERVGGYRDFGGPEDYDLFLRLAEGGGALAKLPDTLLRWRHHGSRSTFADPRYALARFRDTKAPHLAHALVGLGKTRFVIWGGGQTGRSLARALEPHGLRASLFIDIDPRKLGRVARGAPICESSALDVTRDALAVAVGARGARPLIRAELDARGFREGIDYFFAA